MQIWCSYFRYTVRLFLECALFLARCNICTSRETKKEILGYRKEYIEEFVRGTSLFWLDTLPYSMWFSVAFFVFSRPLPKWCTCWMASIKIHTNEMVWWYHEWMVKNMTISCNILLAGWHFKDREIILDFVSASVLLTKLKRATH